MARGILESIHFSWAVQWGTLFTLDSNPIDKRLSLSLWELKGQGCKIRVSYSACFMTRTHRTGTNVYTHM